MSLTVLLLTLSACVPGNAPTAAQAGQSLKNHILRLLKERNAQDVTVTDSGGKDIPCGSGVKQTFSATGRDLISTTKPTALNEMMLGALDRVAKYSVLPGDPENSDIKVEDKATATLLVLNSREVGEYSVQGETECLPAR
ncbi:hypothetical protein [Sphaerisporangium corydalis]|uniref:Lipoprotein n=1 Tax=Sphaerisporangium corydalis TaxID=1441875 RepID=A0ABV9ELK8_9ACTN|nr:hypothetical protein [Sphaerisporangium corydalis]